jgi:hypothetical protein
MTVCSNYLGKAPKPKKSLPSMASFFFMAPHYIAGYVTFLSLLS